MQRERGGGSENEIIERGREEMCMQRERGGGGGSENEIIERGVCREREEGGSENEIIERGREGMCMHTERGGGDQRARELRGAENSRGRYGERYGDGSVGRRELRAIEKGWVCREKERGWPDSSRTERE